LSLHKSNLDAVKHWVRENAFEAKYPGNDGWTAAEHKKRLYELKCMLDDVYPTLPNFVGEEEWEKERLVDLLKRKS